MGVVLLCPSFNVIAGDHQSSSVFTTAKLNAVAGSGGVPRPGGFLGGGGDLARRAPRCSVVVAGCCPDGARGGTGLINDRSLVIRSQVVSHEEVNGAGGFLKNGARVAAGVGLVIPHNRKGAPGLTAISTPAQNQVDITGVASAAAPSLGKGEKGAILRSNNRGNPEGVVALGAALEDIGVLGMSARARQKNEEECQRDR